MCIRDSYTTVYIQLPRYSTLLNIGYESDVLLKEAKSCHHPPNINLFGFETQESQLMPPLYNQDVSSSQAYVPDFIPKLLYCVGEIAHICLLSSVFMSIVWSENANIHSVPTTPLTYASTVNHHWKREPCMNSYVPRQSFQQSH